MLPYQPGARACSGDSRRTRLRTCFFYYSAARARIPPTPYHPCSPTALLSTNDAGWSLVVEAALRLGLDKNRKLSRHEHDRFCSSAATAGRGIAPAVGSQRWFPAPRRPLPRWDKRSGCPRSRFATWFCSSPQKATCIHQTSSSNFISQLPLAPSHVRARA